MTFLYANPPAGAQPAPPTLAVATEATTANPPAWARWIVSFGVAALLVVVFGVIVYFIAPPSNQPAPTTAPAVAPLPTWPALNAPSFAEFSGASGEMERAQYLQISADGSRWACSDLVVEMPNGGDGCPGLMFACNTISGVNDIEGADYGPSYVLAWFSLHENARQRSVEACGWEAMP